jgi:hypothetical protein
MTSIVSLATDVVTVPMNFALKIPLATAEAILLALNVLLVGRYVVYPVGKFVIGDITYPTFVNAIRMARKTPMKLLSIPINSINTKKCTKKADCSGNRLKTQCRKNTFRRDFTCQLKNRDPYFTKTIVQNDLENAIKFNGAYIVFLIVQRSDKEYHIYIKKRTNQYKSLYHKKHYKSMFNIGRTNWQLFTNFVSALVTSYPDMFVRFSFDRTLVVDNVVPTYDSKKLYTVDFSKEHYLKLSKVEL